jgi:PAS domain S-box-containing protein
LKNQILIEEQAVDEISGMRSRISELETSVKEYKREIKEILRDKKKYQSIYELSPDGIITLDIKGKVMSCNRMYFELTGYKEEEIIGRHFTKLPVLKLSEIPKYIKLFAKLIRGEEIMPFEFIWIHADGSRRIGEFRVSVLKEGRKITGVQAVCRDVTEMHERKGQYERLVEDLGDNFVVYSFKVDGTLNYISPGVKSVFGVSVKDALGKRWDKLVDWVPDDLAWAEEAVQNMISGREFKPKEMSFKHPDGSLRTVFPRPHPIRNGNGSVDYIEGILLDITDRNRMVEALRESEERYRNLIESSPDAIIVHSEGTIIYANQAAVKLVGAEYHEELIGRQLLDFIHPDGRELLEQQLRNMEWEDVALLVKEKILRLDGTVVHVEATWTFITYQGQPAVQAIVRDISERHKAEEQNELSQRVLEILNSYGDKSEVIRDILSLVKEFSGCAAVGIRLKDGDDYPYYETNGFPEKFIKMENSLCSFDSNGAMVRSADDTPVMACMCGYVIAGHFDPSRPFFTEGGSFWTNSTSRLLSNTTKEALPVNTRNRCNTEGYESVALIPLKTEEGNIGLLQLNDFECNRFTEELIKFYEGVANSIGIVLARIRAEDALRESEEKFAKAFHASPDSIIITRLEDGAYIDVNDTYLKNTGNKREDVIGRPREKSRMEQSEADRNRVSRLLREHGSVRQEEVRFEGPSGDIIYKLMSAELLNISGERCGMFMASDITERKKAELGLRESEEFNAGLLKNAPNPMTVLNEDTSVKYVNPAFEKLTGYTMEEIAGIKAPFPWWPDYYKNEKLISITDRIKNIKDSSTIVDRIVSKDGQLHTIEMKMVLVKLENSPDCYLTHWNDVTEREKAGAALRESQEFNASLMEKAPNPISVVNGDSSIKYVNPAFEKLTGYSMEEIVGIKIPYPWWPEDTMKERLSGMSMHMGDVWDNFELIDNIVSKDGSHHTVELKMVRVKEKDDAGYYLTHWNDITEREEAVEALRDSEEFNARLLENAPNPMTVINEDTSVKYVNPAFEKMTGFSMEEVAGLKAPYPWWPKEIQSRRTGVLAGRIERGGDSSALVGQVVSKSGERYIVDLKVVPVKYENSPGFYLAHWTDITELKKAEDALREQRNRAQYYLDMAGTMLIVLDTKGFITLVNKRCCEILGYAEEELVGQNWFDNFSSPENSEKYKTHYSNIKWGSKNASRAYDHHQNNVRTASGEERLIDWRSTYLKDDNGLVVGTINSGEDITEHHRAEQELRKSEEKFSKAFLSSPNIMAITTLNEGKFVEINRSYTVFTGFTPEELIGTTATENSIWANHADRDRMLGILKEQGRVLNEEFEFRVKSGEIRTWIFSAEQINIDGQECLIGVSTDITERKQMEKALRESEEKFAKIFHSSPVPVVISRLEDSVISDVNDSFVQLTGYQREEAIGKSGIELGLWLSKEDRNRITQLLTKHGKVFQEEITFRMKSGELHPVLFSADVMKIKDEKHMIVVASDISERKQAERALLESEEKFSKAFHTSPAVILLARTEDGIVIDVNDTFVNTIGFPRDEVIGKSGMELEIFKDMEDPFRIIQLMDKQGRLHQEDITLCTRSGESRSMLLSAEFITIKDEKHIIVALNDITERKQAETALRESEEKFSKAFKQIPDSIVIVRVSDRAIIDVNDTFIRDSGYTREEALGLDGMELGFWRNEEDRNKIWHLLRTEGRVHNEEFYFRLKTREMYARVSAELVNIGGEACVMFTSHDITEKKQAEMALRESQEYNASLLENSPNQVVVINPDSSIQYVNPQFEKVNGWTAEEVIGVKIPYPWWPEELSEEFTAGFRQAFEVESGQGEVITQRKNGERYWLEMHWSSIKDNGELKYLLCNSIDVTERKQAEEALRESEEKFSKSFRASTNAISISRRDNGNFVEINDGFTRLLGYTREEVIGHNATDLNFWVNEDDYKRLVQKLREDDRIISEEIKLRTKSGDVIIALYSSELITINDVVCDIHTTTDITERKKMEEALRESEEKFIRAFNASPNIMSISKLNTGEFIEVNDSFLKFTGYKRKQVIGRSSRDLHLFVKDEDAKKLLKLFSEKGKVHGYEFDLITRSGKLRRGLSSVEAIAIGDQSCLLTAMVDITERKRAEEKLKEMYEKETKMRKELEVEMKRRAEFTRALVHELKTPLTPIIASSDGLTDMLTEEPYKSLAENVNRGALNLNKRISELLDIARGELNVLEINRQPLDLLPVLTEVASEMNSIVKNSGQTLALELPFSLSTISVDSERIKQVIENLLTNATKFTPDGGVITFRASEDKENVIIEVKDTGVGLTKAERQRVFQPYYRKEGDRDHLSGLGLGLAICKNIVDLHGGRIWVRSRPKSGSSFGFSLPLKGD